MVEKYTALADRFGLLKTGGSDFHGSNKADIQLGIANGRRVPREWFDQLITALHRKNHDAIAATKIAKTNEPQSTQRSQRTQS
jgi:hypothetical protein